MQHVDHTAPGQPVDDDALTRTPPYDLVTEQAILSKCMYDPAAYQVAARVIDRFDFYRPAHQMIWDLMGQQLAHQPPLPVDPIALRAEIDKLGMLRYVDGGNYLFEISSMVGGDVEFNAGIVAAKARLRREFELSVLIRDMVLRGVDGETILKRITEFQQAEEQRAGGPGKSGVDAMLAELLDTNSLDNLPALEPLVGDLLHKDTLARIIGPSGHMKSFVVIDFAGHVGTGKPWHGHPVSQGKVVYLVAEGARGIRKRVRAWERHHHMRMDNVWFLPRPVQALDQEWLTLIEACRRVEPALIVIDTQARVSVGVEENSAKELGLVIDRMEQLRASTGACVLLIHHTGHQGDHGRGSTSAKGALQSELHVSKKGDTAASTIVTLKTGKQKDDEGEADIDFRVKVVDIPGEAKSDGRPVTSVVLLPLGQADADAPAAPGTVQWLIRQLDEAQVPTDWGSPRVISRCAELGIRVRKAVIEEAVRTRRTKGTGGGFSDSNSQVTKSFQDQLGQNTPENLPPHLPRDLETPTPPTLGGGQHKTPDQTSPGEFRGRSGEAPIQPPSPLPPSREGGGGGDAPLCAACGEPYDSRWAERGYDTHLICPGQDDAA